MNIHEYQAKSLLRTYGINVLNGYLIENLEDSEKQARKIETPMAMVKAQVHTGGRGKAGGIRLVRTLTEAIEGAKDLMGKRLVTHQTGKEGLLVQKVYMEEACSIKHEYYLSLVLDPLDHGIKIVASKEGGMEIEETAERSPEKIITLRVDPAIGVADFQIRSVIHQLGIPEKAWSDMSGTIKGIFQCFIEKDCNMIEINPLVLSEDHKIIALDIKMSFDDNALYRHPDILALRDMDQEDIKEVEASKHGLSYIPLGGTIACLVNGAGLAMATMDSIKYAGGAPANFLDVGGGASEDNITHAFRIILSDAQVKGIFVNIFGGIMQCDTIARGIVQATKGIQLHVPMVVRLAGANEMEGKKILEESGLDIYTAENMEDGASLIVQLIEERGGHNEYMGQ